jgi:glycosyltransferase involved in cell wall biosynthesis
MRPHAMHSMLDSGEIVSFPSRDTSAISLVIPTYNRGNLVGETIDSALHQHRPFAEIIVVDDGSTDDTAAVLAAYGDRIRVIRVANGGVQRARNIGVAAAHSAWVALCDSDDLLDPGYCATMDDRLGEQPELDAVYCNFTPFTAYGDQPDKFSQAPAMFFEGARRSGAFWHDIPDLYARMLTYQPLFSSGNVMRKSLYEALGGYDPRFNKVGSEDWEFTLRLVAAGRVGLCATPLVKVRKHTDNDSLDNDRQIRGTVQILEYALSQHAPAERYRDAIERNIDERRLMLFDGAFARGEFDRAVELLGQFRRMPRMRRFRTKVFITHLPRLLRQPLWRATQSA